jgi:GNAT superfamily N-acetyltransferase
VVFDVTRSQMNPESSQIPQDIRVRHNIVCGDLGRIIALHGEAYDPLDGFGLNFEAFVARTIADFVLDTGSNGRVWLAERGASLVGCTAIARHADKMGQLRWVLVDPSARGIGLGRQLVEAAIDYCANCGIERIYLETTAGLPESQALYRQLGFEIVSEETADLWNGPAPLITMQRVLRS